MPHRIINTLDDLSEWAQFARSELKLPFTLGWVLGRDRSDDQNNLQWMWAAEVAKQRGDCAAEDVQAEWKLIYGVPILRAADVEFRESYDELIKPFPYHTKLRFMRDLDFGVTRKMKVRQMVGYLDTVQRENLQRGFRLTDPDPDLAKYHARYRTKAAA